MTLQEALKIGERAFGVVKCRYACLYATGGKIKLFSLQGRDTEWDDGGVHTYAVTDKGKKVQYRAPIVIANRADNPEIEDKVLVRFTEYAVDVIGEKYDHTTKQKKFDPNSNYAEIDKILANEEPFKVKSVAIEWFPSGMVFARDGEYADEELRADYNKRLEAARKKMEQAKAVLIGAGLSNLL